MNYLRVYAHVCMYIYMHVNFAYMQTYIDVHLVICRNMYAHAYVYIHTDMHAYIFIYVYKKLPAIWAAVFLQVRSLGAALAHAADAMRADPEVLHLYEQNKILLSVLLLLLVLWPQFLFLPVLLLLLFFVCF